MRKPTAGISSDTSSYMPREAETTDGGHRRASTALSSITPVAPDALGMDGDTLENLESAVQGNE